MFTTNVGSIDRILRIIVGLCLLSLAFIGPKTLWGYVGIILIITAFINFCPLYSVFKINTLTKSK
ncbi:YgaP family membrane protein [Agarilytica rhodophyticola]|uniref:YgaP family membrane protein n=1 Tax=Agarilytica rhodophyticola TaxID=1737490 RepID=UPI000B343A95|nr:DUF2892 domain-containing protein [Agarilytica rhodophyticola]